MKDRVSRGAPFLFAAALFLLMFSAVGSTRAALTYYSENYSAQMSAQHIGVTLNENGSAVSRRNYKANDTWEETSGVLLTALNDPDKNVVPGTAFEEALSVTNSGSIDLYVRVVVRRYWRDAEGKKDPYLSPELIDLHLPEGSGWVVDDSASTPERLVLYYRDILPAGAVTAALSDTLTIDPAVAGKVSVEDRGNGVVATVYDYNGYTFCLEAEADAVQTHNGADAVKSAWGVDVVIDPDGTLRLED